MYGIYVFNLRLSPGQVALVLRDDLTATEIGQFHHRTITDVNEEENVARIQVAVNEAIGVQIV